MHVTAIIAAGGRGLRLGAAVPKQLLEVGGRPVLDRTVAAFLAHPAVQDLIVALPADLAAEPPAYLFGTGKPLHVVAGGARRQDSVREAFRHVPAATDIVVIHDAARPFVSAGLIERTLAAASESGAALAALPARDTVKRVMRGPVEAGPHAHSGTGATGAILVVETLPRESIFLAQTPQAFRRRVLAEALAGVADDATDEAALVERAGHPVRVVEGEPTNIKITTPDDWALAEAIARAGDPGGARLRVGNGYDLHRLVEGRPLILGGVTIPYERGLLGHSDADAVCHAATDAILGAAAAGDIGRLFPDTDPAWKDASSLDLLARAAAVVRGLGYAIVNIDVVVIAERPRIGPFVDAMRVSVAAALEVSKGCVSIKGKTNEGVGETGRGEAIATHAVALLAHS